MRVVVWLHSCDDDTSVELEVDTRDLAVIESLATDLNKAVTSCCQPTMKVERL